eukprot:4584249-Prymnesium_polylepis.1
MSRAADIGWARALKDTCHAAQNRNETIGHELSILIPSVVFGVSLCVSHTETLLRALHGGSNSNPVER